MIRAYFRWMGGTIALFALVVALFASWSAIARGHYGDLLGLVPLGLAYGAFVGFWPGVVAGGARVGWLMAGPTLFLPLVLVPLAISLSFWICSGFVLDLTHDAYEAIAEAARARRVGEGMPPAHHPLVAVIFLVVLAIQLGPVLFEPEVLWALFVSA